MPSVKTKGIVLRGSNFGEADKILTIYTERFGKVKVIAKGVRKIKSHMAGSLEPFMIVDLQLHEGKTFYIVTGASIASDFSALHLELNKTAKAFFLGELIDRFMEEGGKSDEIFELFSKSLEEVDKGLPGPLIQAFELKLLIASGFRPELNDCINCKSKIIPGENGFDVNNGGVVCADCMESMRHLPVISIDALKVLRFIEKNATAEISRLKISENIEVELEFLLDGYIRSVLEREIKSKTFLREVTNS